MGDVAPIGVVTGLQMEAEIARRLPATHVLCYGPGLEPAHIAAQALIQQGVCGLISFGVAGALDPDLKSGSIITPRPDLGASVSASQLRRPILTGAVVSVEAPALTPTDKSALRERTGACAVDMETEAVEGAARAAGLPYGFVRAICDEAIDTIPKIALAGMAADGTTRPLKVATKLVSNPGDLPALLHLGKQQKRALAALSDFVALKPDLAALFG